MGFPNSSRAVDLFSLLALPPLPPPLAEPAFLEKQTSLRLSSTWEELYRKWENGQELARFLGNRQIARLDLRLSRRFGISDTHWISSHQDWVNRETGKLDNMAFTSHEANNGLAVHWWGNDHAVEYEAGQSSDRFNGRFSLNPKIIKALGAEPRIEFQNESGSHAFRVHGRWNDLVYTGETSRTVIDHSIRTLGTRIDLLVPLRRTVKELSGTISVASRDLVQPFIRWYRRLDRGIGVSEKDDRFIFGHTSTDVSLTAHAIGMTVKRHRRPWFVEFSRNHLSGTETLRNNLITIDPLFLFGTNEVRTRTEINGNHPWSCRVGGAFRLPKGFTGSFQYGLSRIGFETVQEDEKVSFLRTRKEESGNRRALDYWLHRSEIVLRRPDRNGSWMAMVHLMVPREIAVPSREALTPTPAPPGPGPAPSEPKPETHVRGGWQFTLERAFLFH